MSKYCGYDWICPKCGTSKIEVGCCDMQLSFGEAEHDQLETAEYRCYLCGDRGPLENVGIDENYEQKWKKKLAANTKRDSVIDSSGEVKKQ